MNFTLFLWVLMSTAASVAPATEERAVKDVLAGYIAAQEAVMTLDAGPAEVERLMSFYTDDFVYHHPEAGAIVAGKDAVRRGVSLHLGETQDPDIKVLDASINGEIVGLATEQSFKIAATKQVVRRRGYTLLRIRDGKIVTRVDM